MIGADDGTSIGDSKNLLLDKADFFVVGRILEQLPDRSGYVGLMISGSMGTTRRDFIARTFTLFVFRCWDRVLLEFHAHRFESLDLSFLPADSSDFDVHGALLDDKVHEYLIL
jgi:hypothetical protein